MGTSSTSAPSAFGQAVLIGMEMNCVQRQIQHLGDLLKQLRRSQRAWEAGGRGEQAVVRVLVGMDDAGWHVLPDRRWPGTSRANIDVLVVGPGGVFVVDVKNWRDVSVEGGRLWRGEVDAEDELRKLVDQAVAVEQVLADAGLPPTEMTWLHPKQARLVGRRSSGPARIRGAAGTGKTVVALHRAKYLAARGDRVLFTSLVRTLAPINDTGTDQQSPRVPDGPGACASHRVRTRPRCRSALSA